MKKLPVSVMEKLLKKSGARRVSESAKEELEKILSKRIKIKASKAAEFSKHAGRKTIKKEDLFID